MEAETTGILERVSEADVVAWMAARLGQIRAAGVPATVLSVQAAVYRSHVDGQAPVVHWGGHAEGRRCTVQDASSAEVIAHLSYEGGDDVLPQGRGGAEVVP